MLSYKIDLIFVKIFNLIRNITYKSFKLLPFLKIFYLTRETQTPVTFSIWFNQKILGFNRKAYWPTSKFSMIQAPEKIIIGIDTSPGYMPGCYIQGFGGIEIGDYTQIAANVGIISSNHDIYQNNIEIPKKVRIGRYCWIGIGSVILPGVSLGDFCIVGAGSIVTKSFTEGYCIIGGNPAKKLRTLEKEKCIEYKNSYEFNGYVPSSKFNKFMKKYLVQ